MFPGEIGPFISRSTPRLLAVVFGVTIALFVVTGFYARAFKQEKTERARQQYEAGLVAAREGHYEEAAELYAEAMTLSRGSPQYLDYQEALGLSLVEAGRNSEAEAYLQQLTRADPSNGIANLMLARIYVERGELDRALEYYTKSIYGLWDQNPREQRIRIRLELVGLFERAGRYQEMEAELLRLQQEAPGDPEMKRQIGSLFLAAKSYDNAVEMFNEVIAGNQQDVEAYVGLGDAEFGRSHYLSAGTAYRKALQYDRDNAEAQRKLALADEIVSLDPTLRGLGSFTRLERSRKLVGRALEGLKYCLPEDRETLPEEVRTMLSRAEHLVAKRIRQQRNMEAVEENIALAERLEAYRSANCEAGPEPDQALRLVLEKLAS